MSYSRAGKPRKIGRLTRPTLPFTLAPNLAAKGALPLKHAIALVVAHWKSQVGTNVKANTIATHCRVLATMSKYMTARGVVNLSDVTSSLLWDWSVAANSRTKQPSTENMVLLRREVAKAFYNSCYLLGLTDENLANFERKKRPERFVCPLTSQQIQQLKDASDHEVTLAVQTSQYERGSLKAPVALALAILGAQPGEVGFIRCADVDLLQQRLWASGGGDRFRPRWIPIDDSWAFAVLMDRIAWMQQRYPGDYANKTLAYTARPGSSESFENRSAATSNLLDIILKKAGVKRKGVRVASITEAVAVKVFAQTQRVEAVAARLGMSSLDRAAHLVSYDWRESFSLDGGQR